MTDKETEAMAIIAERMEALDRAARDRVLVWASARYSGPFVIIEPENFGAATQENLERALRSMQLLAEHASAQEQRAAEGVARCRASEAEIRAEMLRRIAVAGGSAEPQS